jgi:hypothetical protein
MRWGYLGVLYLIILPITVYTSQKETVFSFTIDLLLGYSVAFAIGLVFRKSTLCPIGVQGSKGKNRFSIGNDLMGPKE